MAVWPRDIIPQQTSSFIMPGALQSWSQSGKGQHRATVQGGRIFSETYPPFLMGSAAGRKLIAAINNNWRNGTSFTMAHYAHLTHNGLGSGSPVVNNAGQTGTSLVTASWGGSNPVLRAGDIISIAGITQIFDVTADAPNTVGGITTLSINPPIFVGGSPGVLAAITYTGVLLNACIYTAPNIPNAGPDQYVMGLSVTFREAI